jgi:hypothetical protein
MTTLLEQYTRLQQANEAAEERRRQVALEIARAKQEDHYQSLVTTLREVMGEALNGWKVSYPGLRSNGSADLGYTLTLTPTFAGDNPPTVDAEVLRDDGRATNRPAVKLVGLGFTVYYVTRGDSTVKAMASLAAVLVPLLEQQRERDRHRAEFEALQQRQRERQRQDAERWTRAEEHLATWVNAAEADFDQRIAEVVATYGWPEGRELTVYRIEWCEGVDGDGDPVRRSFWAIEPMHGTDGTWSFRSLDAAGFTHRYISAPNGVLSTTVIWRSADDLPWELASSVYLSRTLTVGCDDRNGDLSGPVKHVHRDVKLPGSTVRSLLGLPTDFLPGLQDEQVLDLDELEGGPVKASEEVQGS